ncbi:carboxylesterase/lipase family protein [Streptomyces neyagawaensis]|uniref:carboxylesterase/lipase family protein n=1 Tax=Streptomyces neyagawaensis TaxID=42238 RepID=UPI00201D074A|nr:carboxylesterase family protein [Streptomyces neyagawaensis]MCL6738168.1 carboxylesterase family protein [Streptomyces neyagawaensis]MDE1685535.1 carboxylesterase family protein [Streptomyces neyagawaensis]
MHDTVSRSSARLWRLAVGATALAATVLTPAPAQAAPPSEPAVVRTDAGWVRGQTTAEGRQFLGIPYARQPVGDLRWTEPRPVSPWQGVREAGAFANRCTQTASWDPGYERPSHTEDCLALNVYTPQGTTRRPVMVWLHGGGLTAGAGEDVVPDAFARRTGTVVVTVNYRLGAMGFLATEDLDKEASDGVSGNFGMLDQQAALRWVRANIGRFGGDPGRVTIAGESAGGRSVCTQLASPTSRGLFRAGIVQSGAYGDCSARTHESAVDQGRTFMTRLGCADTACLRGKTAAEILAAQAGLNWGPVTGGAFLPVQPFEAFRKGAAARVPVLNGANQDEGHLFAFGRFDAAGTPLTAERYPTVMRAAYGDRVLARYPLTDHPSPTIAYGTAQGDQGFACPALRLNEVLAGRGPVYAYEFADRTSPPFASLRNLGTDFDFGATHVNEVQYLFRHFGLDSPLDAGQQALARQMTDYWGSFIRDGVPRAAGQPAVPAGGDRVLTLRTAAQGGNGLSRTVHGEHACDLWDNLPGSAAVPVSR